VGVWECVSVSVCVSVLSDCVWCACVCSVCVCARVPAVKKEKKKKKKVCWLVRGAACCILPINKTELKKNVLSEEQHVAHCKKSKVKYLLSKNHDQINNQTIIKMGESAGCGRGGGALPAQGAKRALRGREDGVGETYERRDNFASDGDAEGEYHFSGSMTLKYDFSPDFFLQVLIFSQRALLHANQGAAMLRSVMRKA
jgi:hypothetical protein